MTPTARTLRRHLSVAPREDAVYILRITLEAVEPLVWRRVQVPGSITLERLHTVPQRLRPRAPRPGRRQPQAEAAEVT